MRLLVALLLFVPASLQAATLSLSAPSTIPLGTEFPVYVTVDSDRGFNAGEAVISFPTDTLEVVSVSAGATATIFNFWLTFPVFSNEKGTVTYSGGTTNGVSGEDVPILTITMRARGVGEALLTADDASINAADGSGRNILEDIEALRLSITQSTIVPPKPVAPTQPTPTPILESAPTQTTMPEPPPSFEEPEACEGLFRCDLPFPSVDTINVTLHRNVAAEVLVTGTAEPRTHVHLLLERDGVHYKEIEALVERDGHWEGLLSGIYAYGTYDLIAWTSSNTHEQRSESVVRRGIDIYPPFTWHPFDFVLRWYAVASGILGIVLGLTGALLLWRILAHRRIGRTLIAFIIAFIAFSAMVATAYILWQEEYQSAVTYWKDTEIPCVLRTHSWIDLYESVTLSITVDGVPETIPAQIGFAPECVASVHTHDNTGRLHFESAIYTPTLGDFFTVADIPFLQEGYALSITVDGQPLEPTAAAGYELRNGDVIEMRFTSLP